MKHLKNLRDYGVKIEFFPFDWILSAGKAKNVPYPSWFISVGPFTFVFVRA